MNTTGDDLPDGLATFEGDEVIQVEVLVGGAAPVPAPPCEHRLGFTEQVTIGLRDDEADGQRVVHREALLKLRCRDCGVPMRFFPGTAHASNTAGELGVVVEFAPVDEHEEQRPPPLALITGS